MVEKRKVQELMGAPGSPYTRKMLGVMRFRHIPYRLERNARIFGSSEGKHRKERVQPKVSLLPTFYYQDEKGGDRPDLRLDLLFSADPLPQFPTHTPVVR